MLGLMAQVNQRQPFTILINTTGDTTLTGKVNAGNEQSKDVVAVADSSSEAYVNGLRIANGIITSEVDIVLHLTRKNTVEVNNQGLFVTGVYAGSSALAGQSGSINISVQGGEAVGASANANATAKGIDGNLNGTNLGRIDVRALAGTADSSGTNTDAKATAKVDGIDGEITVDNRAAITSTGIGGTAVTTGTGR